MNISSIAKTKFNAEDLIEQLELELDVPELDFDNDDWEDDEDDGQPSGYEEYQDLYDGDDSFGEYI